MVKFFFLTFLLLQHSVPLFAQDDLQRRTELAERARKFNISESWQYAKVYAPNEFFVKSVDKLADMNPKNVVVYLHGCGGIGSDEITWAKFLSDNGFVVVLPDSLAITGRKRNCEPGSSTRNAHNVPVGPLRIFEAQYAFEEISKIDSVEKVFLMGHSEGGATILMAPMKKFKAVVSVGSFCSGPKVNISNEVPLLLVNYESDPWFKGTNNLCREKTDHRKENTTELVISGGGHEASRNTEARKTVLDFLTNLIRQ